MRHHVLEHDSNQGLSVLYEDDKLNDAKADAGLMGDLEKGFIVSRKNIPDGERKGIKLGMYSIWLSQVDDQEHMIAFVRPLRDIRAALTMKNPADPDMTLSKLIRETWGLEGWRAVVDYYNVMTQDESKLMRGLLDDEFGRITRNFIATRLVWNWVTYIRQMYSLPLVLPYSGWTSLMSSMAEAVRDGGDFLERVYEMAPEIAERKGDIWTAALRAHEGATGLYKEILDKGLAPIGLIDQVIAAVVFKAVYNAQRKNGASHDKAVREGKHVVALTQSASHAKDATRLMREKTC